MVDRGFLVSINQDITPSLSKFNFEYWPTWDFRANPESKPPFNGYKASGGSWMDECGDDIACHSLVGSYFFVIFVLVALR